MSGKRLCLFTLLALAGCRDWDKLAQDCTVENGCINPSGTGGSGGPTVPAPPTGVVAEGGVRQAKVQWVAPVNNGGSEVTEYTVESSDAIGGRRSATIAAPATEATVTGLANGTTYTFTVKATNAIGPSDPSSLSNAVTTAAAPGAPTNVVATAEDKQATVSWTAPADAGSGAITGYAVTSDPGSLQVSTTGATSAIVTGLTNGTPYTFTVVATNEVGEGMRSAPSNSVTPSGPPGAPTSVSATPGNQQATVQWGPPADTGGSAITGYSVTSTPGNFTANTVGATQAVVTGLTNGTSYTFTVTATNVRGTGPGTSSNAVTPATPPGAPIAVSATAQDRRALVQWSAPPSNGGSAITGYTVTSMPDGFTAAVDGSTLSATVLGLPNGAPSTFSVTATNAIGTGPASTASNSVTPFGLPGVPLAVSADAGLSLTPDDGFAIVRWTAPPNNGSAITAYEVRASPGGAFASVANSPATVSGLTVGTAYSFTVQAINDAGVGDAGVSIAVTPLSVPGAPTAVSAVDGNGQATVQWTAPSSTGGTPLTGYAVTSSAPVVTANGAASPLTVTGLTNGTATTFTVRAINAVGQGPASAPSSAVTPATVPSAPANVRAIPGNAQAAISWLPAFNGGRPLTGYSISSAPAGFTMSLGPTTPDGGPLSSVQATGLSNGTSYVFNVRALNAKGTSDAGVSNPSRPCAAAGSFVGRAVGPYYGRAAAGGLGDFNVDGRLDLVLPYTDGGVAVLPGNGNGTFGAATVYGPGAGVPAVADIDRDGRPDVVVVGGSSAARVYWADSGGSGALSTFTDLTIPGGTLGTYAVGDFDNDGRPDVVTLPRSASDPVSVFRRNLGRSFLAPVNSTGLITTATPNDWVAVSDFDRDGNLDLAWALGGTGRGVKVLLGNGAGGFTSGPLTPSTGSVSGLATGDFNGDGRVDLFAGSFGTANAPTVLLGSGNGFFSAAGTINSGFAAFTGTSTADFDGDGRLDALVAVSNGPILVARGGGDGTLQSLSQEQNTFSGGQSLFAPVGDLTGTGGLSIVSVTTSSASQGVEVLRAACGP